MHCVLILIFYCVIEHGIIITGFCALSPVIRNTREVIKQDELFPRVFRKNKGA
jgi:hypothetical protein